MSDTTKPKRQTPGYVRFILAIYNTALLAAWSYLAFLAFSMIKKNYESSSPSTPLLSKIFATRFSDLWASVGDLMKYSQLAALIEIFFIIIGWVPSKVATAILQCSVRLLVIYGAMDTEWCKTNDVTGTTLTIAYGLSEIIRYSFYALNAISPSGVAPYPIVWLRYTAFIILYPTGMVCEMYLLATTFPGITATNFWSWSLPNDMNVVFYYPWVLWGLLFCFPPGFWQLYQHMWAQRRKVIGGGKTAANDNNKVKKE